MAANGDETHKSKRPATRVVEAGRQSAETDLPVVNTPVWRASTHLYASEAERKAALKTNRDGDFFYGRRGAPTQWSLAQALTDIEPGAHGTILYPSGVAAIAGALLAVLKPGDVLLISDNAYDPSRSMATGFLRRLGIESRFFDPLDCAAFEQLLCERTKAVWLESPGSLTMEVCDVPALAKMARSHGAVSLIDNTWASPLGFAALEHGCDISVMSLSKHVGGHSDLMMGSASAGERYYRKLRNTAQQMGTVVSPDDAALAARGLRTMKTRLDQSTNSALKIADWLKDHPKVDRVMCPMLPGDQGHSLWQRDFTGGCGLFSFVLASKAADAQATLVDNLDLFGIGYSWGGFESLALPIFPDHNRSVMPWPPTGSSGAGLAIRLSIGLEDPDDLIADLARGFEKLDCS